ncbi:DUF423 domain-containing protein [Stappia sp. GBMRC 2046]|uniref:DUF423 domain-containing protein n=1 Tax=Stappia sediminis TaxID=2692190 RepID=A0A7X3LSG4_9HYPH|nr:DUF423 domain-containing protein [Stappia sediminis]MXN64264.1 DUF423 domain-containing protein [Stappia sediminis]
MPELPGAGVKQNIGPGHPGSRLLSGFALICAGLSGSTGVVMSAVAAHAIQEELISTAANMLLFHAGAFVAIGAYSALRRSFVLALGFFLLAIGCTLFSGDLLLRALAGMRAFPNAAPIGGSAMILGWTAVFFAGLAHLFRR